MTDQSTIRIKRTGRYFLCLALIYGVGAFALYYPAFFLFIGVYDFGGSHGWWKPDIDSEEGLEVFFIVIGTLGFTVVLGLASLFSLGVAASLKQPIKIRLYGTLTGSITASALAALSIAIRIFTA